jgi:hypothetical protein
MIGLLVENNHASVMCPPCPRTPVHDDSGPYKGGGEGGGGRPTFHLYLINGDGQGLEQITFSGGFNSFPMFSPDGTKLAWVSDRGAQEKGEFNIFLADWVP